MFRKERDCKCYNFAAGDEDGVGIWAGNESCLPSEMRARRAFRFHPACLQRRHHMRHRLVGIAFIIIVVDLMQQQPLPPSPRALTYHIISQKQMLQMLQMLQIIQMSDPVPAQIQPPQLRNRL